MRVETTVARQSICLLPLDPCHGLRIQGSEAMRGGLASHGRPVDLLNKRMGGTRWRIRTQALFSCCRVSMAHLNIRCR
jgi:hypothetical protein